MSTGDVGYVTATRIRVAASRGKSRTSESLAAASPLRYDRRGCGDVRRAHAEVKERDPHRHEDCDRRHEEAERGGAMTRSAVSGARSLRPGRPRGWEASRVDLRAEDREESGEEGGEREKTTASTTTDSPAHAHREEIRAREEEEPREPRADGEPGEADDATGRPHRAHERLFVSRGRRRAPRGNGSR